METRAKEMNLDLGLIGNGSFGALLDARGTVVWCCMPAFDGDPAFCALLSPKLGGGDWSVELEDFASSEQHYLPNTAVLRTILHDAHGGAVEITDFAPRWRQYGRFSRPVMLARRLRPIAGSPRVRMRPLADWGAQIPDRTWGSNHLRFLLPDSTLRLTTDAPLRLLRDALPFVLDRTLHFVLGPDETLTQPVEHFVHDAEQRTIAYWREWVRYLSIPLEWQDAVIRSAITLKLCQYEDTGGIVAAMTTSIPEAPHTPRNWDYRYCWLRDAAFVVCALNRWRGLGQLPADLFARRPDHRGNAAVAALAGRGMTPARTICRLLVIPSPSRRRLRLLLRTACARNLLLLRQSDKQTIESRRRKQIPHYVRDDTPVSGVGP